MAVYTCGFYQFAATSFTIFSKLIEFLTFSNYSAEMATFVNDALLIYPTAQRYFKNSKPTLKLDIK